MKKLRIIIFNLSFIIIIFGQSILDDKTLLDPYLSINELIKYEIIASNIELEEDRPIFYAEVAYELYQIQSEIKDEFVDLTNRFRTYIKNNVSQDGLVEIIPINDMPVFNYQYEPIIINKKSIEVNLHQRQARILKKQYILTHRYIHSKLMKYKQQLNVLSIQESSELKLYKLDILEISLEDYSRSNDGSFYSDQTAFIQNIKLPKYDIKNSQHIKVLRDMNDNVSQIFWINADKSVNMMREYEYHELDRLVHIINWTENRITSETWFKDINKSYDFYNFIFNGIFIPHNNLDRITEIYYDDFQNIILYIFMDMSRNIIGSIDLIYELPNTLVKEIWYKGENIPTNIIREIELPIVE
jgi:hypothetical protein